MPSPPPKKCLGGLAAIQGVSANVSAEQDRYLKYNAAQAALPVALVAT